GLGMQNHPGTQEADPRDDTLNDPAYTLRIVGDGENGKRRSKSDKPQGSHSRSLVMQVAIETDGAAHQHRTAEAKNDVRPADHAIISDARGKQLRQIPRSAPVPRGRRRLPADAICGPGPAASGC